MSQDSIVIVIGGTDDLNLPVLEAYTSNTFSNNDPTLHLLRIDPQLDME